MQVEQKKMLYKFNLDASCSFSFPLPTLTHMVLCHYIYIYIFIIQVREMDQSNWSVGVEYISMFHAEGLNIWYIYNMRVSKIVNYIL